ncbi:MAG: hypothetical protein J3K34DRAFT_449346 [Monoraphidium minutum]|nr:MAG: hypothetical protein J3K34DRAFT_449346 [Monoraphidium minutum]
MRSDSEVSAAAPASAASAAGRPGAWLGGQSRTDSCRRSSKAASSPASTSGSSARGSSSPSASARGKRAARVPRSAISRLPPRFARQYPGISLWQVTRTPRSVASTAAAARRDAARSRAAAYGGRASSTAHRAPSGRSSRSIRAAMACFNRI